MSCQGGPELSADKKIPAIRLNFHSVAIAALLTELRCNHDKNITGTLSAGSSGCPLSAPGGRDDTPTVAELLTMLLPDQRRNIL